MQRVAVKNLVVGAGAMGSATAYHLARRGEEVWLVEQFALGHARGSSHGAARITRHSYADPDYARLMPLAFRAWRELEADAGVPLFIRTGGVSFTPPGVSYVEPVSACILAWLLLAQRLDAVQISGGLVVLLGAYVAQSAAQPRVAPEPLTEPLVPAPAQPPRSEASGTVEGAGGRGQAGAASPR